MGARVKRRESMPDLGLVVSAEDNVTTSHRSIKRCSWDFYRDQYPYGVVIGSTEMALANGLAVNKKAPAIIMGETGTGKEVLAKLIHSLRCEQEGKIPFVAVNCATITENLCESILFGHRRGSFTGADSSTNGYIHEANGGILFLDEIHTLPLSVQQKLLRVLNDGTYNRLGETVQLRSSFQLVAASTKDLDDEVDANRFLLDLRTRLTGVDINLLPLRDRRDDIPALIAKRLTDNETSINNRLFDQLVSHISDFQWRGNIRQLFKAIDTWVLMSKVMKQSLSVENFPEFKGMRKEVKEASKSLAEGAPDQYQDIFNAILEGRNIVDTLESLEALMLKEAIKKHKTIGEAASALGIPRSTIDTKRRKYSLAGASLYC